MRGHVWSRDRVYVFLPAVFPCVKADCAEQMAPCRDRTNFLVGRGCDDFPVFVLLRIWEPESAYWRCIWSRSLVVEEIFLWYNVLDPAMTSGSTGRAEVRQVPR